jgi:diaminopimelate epimerase
MAVWMSGAGNLFVVVDGFQDGAPADPAALARTVCALPGPNGRRADGLLLALPPRRGGHCAMEVYNADGTRPEMCGNGLRCVAKLVADRGHVVASPFTIETDAGPRVARVTLRPDRGVVAATIHMGTPRIVARDEQLGDFRAVLVDMGNPHCVLFVDDERTAPVAEVGPLLQRHPRFPQGTNVEFLARREGEHHLRVWERGVGETLACGSGACAAAVASVTEGRARWPVRLHLPGGVLVVASDGASGVTLEGPVEELPGDPLPRTTPIAPLRN